MHRLSSSVCCIRLLRLQTQHTLHFEVSIELVKQAQWLPKLQSLLYLFTVMFPVGAMPCCQAFQSKHLPRRHAAVQLYKTTIAAITVAKMLSLQEQGLLCHVECALESAAGAQDPPEYYDPPGGLLAYQPQLGNLVNESVITGDGMELDDYRGHFNLVNAQLTQVCPTTSSLLCKLI